MTIIIERKTAQPNDKPLPKTACGTILHNPENYPSAEYNGRRVYFCLAGCLKAFENDPERFMDGEIPHPVK